MSLAADPVAPLRDDELRITRVFDAPLALVFHLWDEREHMKQWWGPKDFTTPTLEWELRVGAAWRACIRSASGGESWMSGVIQTVEREKRIVFTFKWDHDSAEMKHETLITVTFREEGGKTVQEFHQTPFRTVESRDSHHGGWSQFIDREQAFAEMRAKEKIS